MPQEPGGEVTDTAVQDAEDPEPCASGSSSEAVLDRLIMRSLNNQDFTDASAPPSESDVRMFIAILNLVTAFMTDWLVLFR